MVLGGAKMVEKYVELYLDRNLQRVANMSGMEWALFILKTPGECHAQLRMNIKIFMDLHDLLVSRYALQSSMHINTYEVPVIFLFVCFGNEFNRRT
jgi:hypothetical protein